MESKTKVINYFGGPGSGKSTTATGVFSLLKQKGYLVEYVSEYAKEVTWDETPKLLENQVHVFAEQLRRQWRLIDKVDYIITDSPLLLSSIYFDFYFEQSKNKLFSETHRNLTRSYFDQTFQEFNNINFFISRNKPYINIGRNQQESEAKIIDEVILEKLKQYEYYSVNSQNSIEQTLHLLGM